MFLLDLANSNLFQVYNYTDPDVALEFWERNFLNVYDKHAPFVTKRVKYKRKAKWWDQELNDAVNYRDKLKAEGKEELSKHQRNKVTTMKRRKKNKHFQDLTASKKNTKDIWKAINELTGNCNKSNEAPINDITCEEFNSHFNTV